MPVECRFYQHLATATPASVGGMDAPLTADAYLEGLGRHRGRIVVVGGDE